MHDLPEEYDLQKEPDTIHQPRPGRSSRVPWLLAAVLVLAAAAGVWYLRRDASPPVASSPDTTTPAATETTPPAPLGAETTPIDLPPLGESDALVRDLVRALSSHPAILAWLATDGLIRNAVVVVENIASGATPAGHLRVLKPAAPFRVVDADGELQIDPASYTRYDRIAAAMTSIDAAGAARLYSTLKPRLEEAYAELGHDGSIDRAVEAALVLLLRTPAIGGEIALAPQGAVYAFDDPRLEALTPAQKQLLRMGPGNVRAIQGTLREIALALGIPSERLPGV